MKEPQQDSWPVDTSPAPGTAWLHRETILTKDGVGAKLSIYPATIVHARYNGSYEGAPWLCFPVQIEGLAHHDERSPGFHQQLRHWDGDEIECERFWRRARDGEYLIGRGDSPTAAYDDLIDRACARVGVDRAALTEEPA
jgi:hypothetical protein